MAVVAPTTVTPTKMADHLSIAVEKATPIHAEAVQIVMDAFAGAWRDVPVEPVDDVVYRVGRALRDAGKRAATGAGQVTATEAAPLRAPADPLASSYPIIRRYVVVGI